MKDSTTKEKVLKKIRNALISRSENPFPYIDYESPIYNSSSESLDIVFAKEFTQVGGKFVFCESEKEFLDNLKLLFSQHNLDKVFCFEKNIATLLSKSKIPFTSSEEDFLTLHVGITYCEYLIARLGSVMVSSKQLSGRRLNVYPEIHIVLAYTSQLVPDLKHALRNIKKKYSSNFPSLVSVITGPSRTADIEKTLVMGAHGPKELYVFLVDDTQDLFKSYE